jgi:hypothetical protein
MFNRPTQSRYYDQVASLKRQLLSSGKLYEDKEFPANDKSLAFSRKDTGRLVWKRPHVSMLSLH